MSLPALIQTKTALSHLAIAGLSAGSKRLPKLAPALEAAGAPVLSRLAAQLRALAAAPQASELIAAFSRSRAILSTQHRPAPTGALQPWPERATGDKSGRFSGQLIYALRAALTKRGPGRMELFEPTDDPAQRDSVKAALAELRLRWLLPAALGDSIEVAEFIHGRLISYANSDPSVADEVEASLSGAPSADARRLSLISAISRPRGHKLAHRLLKDKPKTALKAQIFLSLADDPGALSILLAGAKKGAMEAKKAAFAALAQRREPEAIQAIIDTLGKPGKPRDCPWPESFELLQDAFCYISDPRMRQIMQDALLDNQIPFEDTSERWSRSSWSEALAACPPDGASITALATACEAGCAPAAAVELLAKQAPPSWLKRLILPKTRAKMDGEVWNFSLLDLLLRAAARLPPDEFYEILSPGFEDDALLHEAMTSSRPANAWGKNEWRGLPIIWDPRWLELAKDNVFVTAALAHAEDTDKAPLLLARLPKTPADEAEPILLALKRMQSPQLGEATLEVLGRLLRDPDLCRPWTVRPLLLLLAPPDLPGLEALLQSSDISAVGKMTRLAFEERRDELIRVGLKIPRAASIDSRQVYLSPYRF